MDGKDREEHCFSLNSAGHVATTLLCNSDEEFNHGTRKNAIGLTCE
jgi:hypothetical protein